MEAQLSIDNGKKLTDFVSISTENKFTGTRRCIEHGRVIEKDVLTVITCADERSEMELKEVCVFNPYSSDEANGHVRVSCLCY